MSFAILNRLGFGKSATPSNNAVIRAPDIPDGSLIVSRGNPDAPGAALATFNADGSLSPAAVLAANENSQKVATTIWAKLGLVFSLADPGYIKFPDWLGGLIIQWGSTTTSATATAGTNVTFPLAFPTAARAVFVSNTSSSTSGLTIYGGALTNTKFTSAASAANVVIYWLAFGH